jgi:hypothetical protein
MLHEGVSERSKQALSAIAPVSAALLRQSRHEHYARRNEVERCVNRLKQ